MSALVFAAQHLTVTLATVRGVGEAAEKLGVIAVALLAAVVVLGGDVGGEGASGRVGVPHISQRTRALALLAALVLTPVLLAIDVWHTTQVEHLRAHPAEAAGAIVLGLLVVVALAVLVYRRPRAFPILAVAALPFRLPISTGGSTSNLLIPLYLVVGAGSLAYLTPRLLGARVSDPVATDNPSAALAGARGWWRWATAPRGLEWLLMASVVLYALQAAYSADFSKALENMVFFYVPFALLFALLREVRWTRELLLVCLATAVALAVAFAGIGFVEYYRKHLFLNPKVVAANEYSNFFRVNSLFFDPNIYGRFLALVMVAVTAGVLWSVRRREVLLGGAVLLWLLGGLVTSFSQSSIAALLLGLAVLAAWRWDVRGTLYVAGALVAIALVAVALAPPSLHLGLSGKGGSASNATSGRTKLIKGGLRLFADRPLQGFGPGSFALEYRDHEHVDGTNATSASHTIPITVAAEQGIVGVALYVALLISAFAVLFTDAGRSPPRVALAACFTALVLHTFTYADFLEDPLTWTLLGIGVALASRDRLASRRCATT
ncbi:MAG TPA: O-antigen ligase family protein [Solirubrobacteraceae bacterium]|jgi:putative inorganic carbon (HCO3(-)) transporter|nr:O-antigen ligase family protein [Solirubrobacteraceae bacterium]